MTNEQAGELIAHIDNVTQKMVNDVVGSTAGTTATTTPDASTARALFNAIKTTYDTDPTIFIDTQQNIDDLKAVYDLANALRVTSMTSISDAITALNAAAT